MKWIIENLVKEPSFLELSNAVRASRHDLQEIMGDFAFADIEKYKDECVIFNGSIEMCKHVVNRLKGKGNHPVLYCTWRNYLCSSYYSHFAGLLFNDNYVMLPLAELNRRKFELYGMYGKDTMLFIRPDTGDKSFKGSLVDLQDFDSFYDEFEHLKHDLVVISSPKEIRGEWRFVVSATGDVIASSCYQFQSKKTVVNSAPASATALAQKIALSPYAPDNVFCVDVAQDAEGKSWLLELTSFSSAGLYACDKEAIVEEVSKIAERDCVSASLSLDERIGRVIHTESFLNGLAANKMDLIDFQGTWKGLSMDDLSPIYRKLILSGERAL